jgi:hypothetical protein
MPWSSSLGQRLIEVGDEIADGFDADRQTDER